LNAKDPDRRLVLLTGATGAFGKAIALQIAAKPGYELVLLCRDKHRARQAVGDIQHCSANENVSYELVDLSSQNSIQELARKRQEPVHVLINNAAVTPRRRRETSDGIELQFATADIGQQETGGYFEHMHRQHCRFAADVEAVEALYATCLSYQS